MRRLKLYMAVVAEVEEIVRRNIKESFIFLTKIAAAVKVEELRKEYEDKGLLAVGANIL